MTAGFPRSLLIACACLALAGSLGGCGRKGPLERPPLAQGDLVGRAAPIFDDEGEPVAAEQPAEAGKPDTPAVAAAKARKRRIILDNLLD